MSGFRALSLVALSIVPTAGPSAAFAAPVAPAAQAQGSVRLIQPATVQKVADLDFGGVAVTTAGTVVVDPNANNVTTTGGAMRAGGNPHPAVFVGSAVKQTVVIIRIPKQPITLTRSGGTETMTVSNWTLQGQDKRTLAAMSSFTFAVGGTLNVAANQAEGFYEGSFTVEVQYP